MYKILLVSGLILVLMVTGCTQPSVETPIPTPTSEVAETPSQPETTEPSQTPAKEPATTTEPEPTPKPTIPAPERQQEEEYYIDGEKYILPTFEELERERDGLTRSYPKTVNAVWEPAPPYGHRLINDSLPELRDLGVNTIHVPPVHYYEDDNFVLTSARLDNHDALTGEKAEREFIDRVVKAKKAGFTVSIALRYSGKRHTTLIIPDLDAFDEFALQQAKKWALIAEEYQVEYFSPLSEYEKQMAAQGLSGAALVERVNSWNQNVLAEVRPIFTGKIFLKVSSRGLDSFSAQSASGFDIFAISFTTSGKPGVTQEELRESIQEKFNDAQTVAERDNVEWMVGEFFLHIEGRSEEERVELFRLVFEEYKRTLKGENKPVGFTFFGWGMPEGKVKDTEIVPFLKQFFHDISSVEQEATAQQN